MKQNNFLIVVTVISAISLGTGCSNQSAAPNTSGNSAASAPSASVVTPELDARHSFNTVSLADSKVNDIFINAGTAKDKSGKDHTVLASYFTKEDDVIKVLTNYMSDDLAKSTYDTFVDTEATQKLGIGIVLKDNVKYPVITGDKNVTYKDLKIDGNQATLTAKEQNATINYVLSKDTSGTWKLIKKSF